MIDLYLKTTTKQEMVDALPFLYDAGTDEFMTSSEHHNFLEIGEMWDSEGNSSVYYANMRCIPEIAAQVPDSIKIYPATPTYTWL